MTLQAVRFAGRRTFLSGERPPRKARTWAEPAVSPSVALKSTLSELMGALMVQGLVDIGPDAWGTSYRIGVTRKGQALVAKLLDVAGVRLR